MDLNDTNDKDKAQGENGAISSDLIRGHINTIILRTLYDGDKYGYEIISEIEEKSKGQYALKQPTLYSALKRLESQDFVTSYWGGVSNGGRRKYFQITDKGRKVVEQNLAEWEYSRTVIDSLISERDYDFNNPPPAANVDFSLLKKSTSRVYNTSKDEDEASEPSSAAKAKEPVLAGWTRENPLEAMRSEEENESDADESPVDDPADAKSIDEVKQEAPAAETAPQPTIITQETSSRWTREHPLENVITDDDADAAEKAEYDRTLEGNPVADNAESGENVIEESRPLTEEERQRIHENYRSLIGDEDDATSYYYSQVAKSRSDRPTYTPSGGGDSSRTAGYTMDQYAAQNDLYAEEAQQMYEPEMPAPARYEEAYRQNKAISSELLYSDKSPEERNYKDLLSKLYDNTRREYDDYDGYGGYANDYSDAQSYEGQNYEPQDMNEARYPQEAYYNPEEQPVPPRQPEQPHSVKAAPETPAPKSPQNEKSVGSTSANAKIKQAAPEETEENAFEKKAKSDGLHVATARETRPQAIEESLPAGKTFDRSKVLLTTAIWVFCVALAESIINACLINVINSGVLYIVIPFIIDFLFIGVFLFLYLRGFGKNSRRSASNSYISASFVIFANIILIVSLIAYLLIIFSDAPNAGLGLHILQYAIFPIIYAFNLPLFAMLYNYNCKKL